MKSEWKSTRRVRCIQSMGGGVCALALMGCSSEATNASDEYRAIEQTVVAPVSEQDVAVFLVQTQLPATVPITLEDVTEALIETDEFFAAQSYGGFDLNWEGNVHVVSHEFVSCNERGTLEDEVVERAEADIPGFDPSDYDHIMFIVDVNEDCGAAYGDRDGLAHTGYYESISAEAMSHETGHSLGLVHARGLVCVDTEGEFTSLTGSCTVEEYGDRLDVMGTANFGHFSSYNKSRLSWLAPGQEVSATNEDVVLSPLESDSPGVKSVLVPVPDSDEQYHLELTAETLIGPQVVLRKIVDGVTILINASPEEGADWQNMQRAGLLPGVPLHDAEAGITFTVMSLSDSEAVVRVETEEVERQACNTENALSLGSMGSGSTVASDACLMVDDYPSYFQWGARQVNLQVQGTGTFPLDVSYRDSCTDESGSFTFTGPWQQMSVGVHEQDCPTLIQLEGDAAPVQLTWYP